MATGYEKKFAEFLRMCEEPGTVTSTRS